MLTRLLRRHPPSLCGAQRVTRMSFTTCDLTLGHAGAHAGILYGHRLAPRVTFTPGVYLCSRPADSAVYPA